MIKVFYWAPFISKIATPNAVINSALSLKKYSKGNKEPMIIKLFNEWSEYSTEFKDYKIQFINLFKFKLNIVLPERGFLLSRLSFLLISFISFLPLLKLLKEKKPNYLVIHLNTALPLILLYLFKFETKFILRISGKPRLNFLRKFLWKLISEKIYKVTAPTKIIADDLINKKIFSEKKIDVLYDPVIKINNYTKRFKKKFENKNKIIAIGRLTAQKNFPFLIDCFSSIEKKYDSYTLHILGDGEQKNKLERLIKSKNLNNKVYLHGYKKNINEYLNNSFCFVLSSLWEDPGFVIIEAAMNNTVILSTNCDSGPRELLKNKENSFVFNNKESFIRSFENLVNSDEDFKHNMKIKMKKNVKKFTLFRHYLKLNKIIL
tara:strand:- start:32884 stop:34011 length:1128 start_codon:yes stop_codon:yes gene_type:complete